MTIWSMKASTDGRIDDYPRNRDRPERPALLSGPRHRLRPHDPGDRRAHRGGPHHRRRGGRGAARCARVARRACTRTDAGGARRHRIARRRRRRRLRRDDRVRGPRDDLHRSRPGRAAPAEPAHEPCGRCRTGLPARDRAGDAPAPGEHAGPRPQRLPAGRRRHDPRAPRPRHPPGRAGAGECRGVGRPRPARPPSAAAHRSRPGRGRWDRRLGRRRPEGRRPGADGTRREGGHRPAERHPDDGRDRRPAPR